MVADRKEGRTACYRHGLFTNEAIGELRMIRGLLRDYSRSERKLLAQHALGRPHGNDVRDAALVLPDDIRVGSETGNLKRPGPPP
jgi:hypothetical protein